MAAAFSKGGVNLEDPSQIDEGLIRHMILNSIRMYNLRYREKYGRMVLACDSSSWRKEAFPEYKANRKKNRSEKKLHWDKFFEIANRVRDEISENFPYPVICVPKAEADDIIGVIVSKTKEPIMIISSDKDFLQLQFYKNVEQFSPMLKKPLMVLDAEFYLFEHICRGDSVDGVPNIMSPDNTFTDNLRQNPLSTKKIREWWDAGGYIEEIVDNKEIIRNYQRNEQMIDLQSTPQDIQDNIMEEFNRRTKDWEYKEKSTLSGNILNYLISKRCGNLIGSVQEFYYV